MDRHHKKRKSRQTPRNLHSLRSCQISFASFSKDIRNQVEREVDSLHVTSTNIILSTRSIHRSIPFSTLITTYSTPKCRIITMFCILSLRVPLHIMQKSFRVDRHKKSWEVKKIRSGQSMRILLFPSFNQNGG